MWGGGEGGRGASEQRQWCQKVGGGQQGLDLVDFVALLKAVEHYVPGR